LSFQFSVGDRFFGTGRLFLVHPTDTLAIFSGNDIGGDSSTEFFANATGFDSSVTAAYFSDLIFADQITINELEPTITSFSPTLGAAGSSVTLVGTNLKGVTGLSIFSGATESSPIANTSFASQTSTQISFTAPSFSEASGQIKLRTNSYEVNSTDYFRYAQDPAGGAISPETGQAGDTITVTASAGLNDTQELRLVTVDNLTVTGQFTIIDDTQLTFIIPSEGRLPAPQVVDVQTYNGVSSTSNGSLTVRENSKDIFGDVDISGNLSVSGSTVFANRPTMSGTGFLLSGEAAGGSVTVTGSATLDTANFSGAGAVTVYLDDSDNVIVSGLSGDANSDVFNGDGATVLFQLSQEVSQSQNVIVSIDGLVQTPSGTASNGNYRVYDGTGLLFGTAPLDGTEIEVRTLSAFSAGGGAGIDLTVTGSSNLSSADLTGLGNVTVSLDGNTIKISGESGITNFDQAYRRIWFL